MAHEHYVVVAVAKAQAGKEEALSHRLEGVARASWEEPGVVSYAVHDLVDSSGEFMMVEVYQDRVAFDAHLETDHVKALLADLGSLVDGDLVVYQANASLFSEGKKGVL